jgi:hypothetical protein
MTVRIEENVMNREDMNWLLQTIEDPDNAKRFVLAQYEHGRISLQVMVDVAEERGWIKRTANQFPLTARYGSIEYGPTRLTAAAA